MGKRIFSIFIVAVMLMTSCIVTSAGEYAEGDGQWEPDWAYSEEGNEWWSEVVENIETWNENSWYDTTSDEEIYPDYPENTYVDPENIPFSEDDWYTQNDDITPMENSIIEINGVGYANMADAVANSQNNDVLKLTADIFLANPVHIAWTWDGKLYLDLNGHDIRLYGAEENSADQDNSGALYDEGMGGMIILENGTLEVIDTSSEVVYDEFGAVKKGRMNSTNRSEPVFLLKTDGTVETHLIISKGVFINSENEQPLFDMENAYGQRLIKEDIEAQDTGMSISVSEGTFSQQLPDGFIAQGSVMTDNGDGTWDVGISDVPVYTVAFDPAADGIIGPMAQYVPEGGTVTDPGPILLDGFIFGGWCDRATDTYYDFSTPVYNDLILYAWWDKAAPETYTVTFDPAAEGIEAPETQTVEEGYRAADPGVLYREGFTFGGWCDSATDQYYDFSVPVFRDLALYAWWEEYIPETYLVVFEVPEDESLNPESEIVQEGDTADDPGSVEIPGYVFEGWYDKSTDEPFDFGTPVYEDITLYAQAAQIQTSTVYFDARGYGEDPAPQTVENGSFITEPQAPYYEGAVFSGWYTSADYTEKYDFSSPVYSSFTLYAKYDAVYCTVTFDLGGKADSYNESIAYGQSVLRPVDPQAEGFVFEGWYADPDGYEVYDFSRPVTGNTIIYAIWSAAPTEPEPTEPEPTEPVQSEYKVTYSYNGMGNDPYLEIYVKEGEKVHRYEGPAVSGYTFAGWYLDSECTELYNFDTPVSSSFTLYAKWINAEPVPETFSVTFYTYYGTAPDGQLVELGNQVVRPEDPMQYGYVFEGWYTDYECTVIYDFEAPVYQDMTLFAKWSEAPVQYFTVSFYSAFGIIPDDQIVEGGQFAARPADPTAQGHVFCGWFTDPDGQEPYSFNTPVTADIRLFAAWADMPSQNYVIYFDSNGHGDTPNPQTVQTGYAAERPADPYAAGYTFNGWFTEAACVNAYNFNNPVYSDMTLYAKWIANTYTVRFDSNGGAGTMQSQTYQYGVWAVLPACQFSRSGYLFAGWNTAADGSGQYCADGAQVANLTSEAGATVSLYAQWKNKYSVIEGSDAKYQRGSKNSMTFRVDGDFAKFTGIQIDGMNVAATQYSAWSGSTYVQIRPEYMNQLTAEKHTIRFMYTDGSVDTSFEIISGTPTTGDTNNVLIWIIIAIAAVVVIAVIIMILIGRRRSGRR